MEDQHIVTVFRRLLSWEKKFIFEKFYHTDRKYNYLSFEILSCQDTVKAKSIILNEILNQYQYTYRDTLISLKRYKVSVLDESLLIPTGSIEISEIEYADFNSGIQKLIAEDFTIENFTNFIGRFLMPYDEIIVPDNNSKYDFINVFPIKPKFLDLKKLALSHGLLLEVVDSSLVRTHYFRHKRDTTFMDYPETGFLPSKFF